MPLGGGQLQGPMHTQSQLPPCPCLTRVTWPQSRRHLKQRGLEAQSLRFRKFLRMSHLNEKTNIYIYFLNDNCRIFWIRETGGCCTADGCKGLLGPLKPPSGTGQQVMAREEIRGNSLSACDVLSVIRSPATENAGVRCSVVQTPAPVPRGFAARPSGRPSGRGHGSVGPSVPWKAQRGGTMRPEPRGWADWGSRGRGHARRAERKQPVTVGLSAPGGQRGEQASRLRRDLNLRTRFKRGQRTGWTAVPGPRNAGLPATFKFQVTRQTVLSAEGGSTRCANKSGLGRSET